MLTEPNDVIRGLVEWWKLKNYFRQLVHENTVFMKNAFCWRKTLQMQTMQTKCKMYVFAL